MQGSVRREWENKSCCSHINPAVASGSAAAGPGRLECGSSSSLHGSETQLQEGELGVVPLPCHGKLSGRIVQSNPGALAGGTLPHAGCWRHWAPG